MKKIIVARALKTAFSIALGISFSIAQSDVTPRNRIGPTLNVVVEARGQDLQFSYAIANAETSTQNIWEARIFTDTSLQIGHQMVPSGWKGNVFKKGGSLVIFWSSPGDADIRPGDTLSGYSVTTRSLAAPVTYYAEGYAPPPRSEEDPIPGYDDLTAYGPGVIGKTIGPKPQPVTLLPLAFLDTLVSYKHQAHALGWITNEGILNSLDQKLTIAEQRIEAGNNIAARNVLRAFVSEVEAQNGRHLTSEAYALLKFNAEYLISRLE